MAVVALQPPPNEDAIVRLQAAIERARRGETLHVTIMEEFSNGELQTSWSGSADLLKVLGHLARMMHNVQKRIDGDL